MDAQAARRSPHALPAEAARFFYPAALCAFVALTVLSAALLLRRAVGSVEPSENAGPLLIIGALALLAYAVRWFLVSDAQSMKHLALLLAPTIALVLLAIALTKPSEALLSIGLWLIVLGEEASWWRHWLRGAERAGGLLNDNERAAETPLALEASHEDVASEDERLLGPDTTQLVERTSVDGRETITGLFRVDFAESEQTTDFHVAFCPPLGSVPSAELCQVDGVECAVRLVETRTYGVRAELRRSRPLDTGASVMLQLSACEVGE